MRGFREQVRSKRTNTRADTPQVEPLHPCGRESVCVSVQARSSRSGLTERVQRGPPSQRIRSRRLAWRSWCGSERLGRLRTCQGCAFPLAERHRALPHSLIRSTAPWQDDGMQHLPVAREIEIVMVNTLTLWVRAGRSPAGHATTPCLGKHSQRAASITNASTHAGERPPRAQRPAAGAARCGGTASAVGLLHGLPQPAQPLIPLFALSPAEDALARADIAVLHNWDVAPQPRRAQAAAEVQAHLRPGTPLLRSSLRVIGLLPVLGGGGGSLGEAQPTDTIRGARVVCMTGAGGGDAVQEAVCRLKGKELTTCRYLLTVLGGVRRRGVSRGGGGDSPRGAWIETAEQAPAPRLC